MPGLWVLAEGTEHTLELLNVGQELAAKMGSRLVAWSWREGDAQRLVDAGADEVWVMPPAEGQPIESCVPVVAEEARKHDPDLIMLGGTLRFKEMAARIASRLDTGLCSDCVGVRWDDSRHRLEMQRMVFGGAGVQTVVGLARPLMATIPARTFDPATAQSGRTGDIRELAWLEQPGVKVIERRPKTREAGDIAEAKAIVCVGRGIEKQEDLALVLELAEVLGGSVACTRPIAEELGWLPEEKYIGLSGRSVKPDLYIGLGVSGQIQHTTGIRGARVIVAVNRDEKAPIFEAADYGVVGDLYQVVPELLQELKQALKR